MANQKLNNKIIIATKWSAIAEIIAKLVSPITSMILARLLTPEAFGIVATLTVVITFAELFTDAGFQKYLVQHEFNSDADKDKSTNVAFWSNLVLSLIIWFVIFVFREQLANVVGSPGLGLALVIACASIPLAAFSSIQTALYKRDLDFKTLFKVRLAGLLVPIFITLPLALLLRSYWALVIGTIISNLLNAILLTLYSKWKPSFYYSWIRLKEMFSFTSWSLVEAIALWATGYIDIFIVGRALDQYYLGLYTTSISLVGQIMGLITTSTTPILFSSLSRLQNNHDEFKLLFLKFQKYVGVLIIPAGVGIYCFSDFVTNLFLGDQWTEASGFVGLWGLTSAVTIVFAHYCGEVYRSMGRPKLSVLVQVLHIVVLCPVVIIAVKYSFEILYVARSLVRLELVLVNMIALYVILKVKPLHMVKNVAPSIISSLVMFCVGKLLIDISYDTTWILLCIGICTIFYFAVILLFPSERKLVVPTIRKVITKDKH